MNEQTKARIKELQKEKDVVILAHYYVDGEVQEIADYVGDSYYLAKVATTVEQQNILFCGVSFMGESAKLLNAKKHVYMADDGADCPMAHMAEVEKIEEVRKEYPDVAGTFRCLRDIIQCTEDRQGIAEQGHLFYSGLQSGTFYSGAGTGEAFYLQRWILPCT